MTAVGKLQIRNRPYGLAPTKEVFTENVKRIQYQATRWRALEARYPTELYPLLHGWLKDTTLKSVRPFTLPTGIPVRIRVRIDFPHLLVCCKRRVNGYS